MPKTPKHPPTIKTAVPDLDFNLELPDFGAETAIDFDADEPRRPPGQELGIPAARCDTKPRRRLFYDLQNVPNAVALIRPLPRPGETAHCLMDGTFNGWDLIPAIHDLCRAPFEELWIATLGFNARNNAHLLELLDAADVRRVAIVCSEYFKEADPDVFQAAQIALQARGYPLVATRVHAKVICARIAGRHLVVESSANLRSCNSIEQFTLTNDRRLFTFHKTWIAKLCQTTPPPH